MISTLQYFGGKNKMLKIIIPLLESQPHRIFADVYGGSAAVIANKRPVIGDYYNDLNGRLINFFRVARDNPADLISALELTPYSRQEFGDCIPMSEDPIEDARRLFVILNQSGTGRLSNPAWIRTNHHNPAQGSKPKNFYNKIKSIKKIF